MIEKFKTNAEVIENGDKYLYGNHVRMPLSIERGEGAYVFDKDGNKYLDFIGGVQVARVRPWKEFFIVMTTKRSGWP